MILFLGGLALLAVGYFTAAMLVMLVWNAVLDPSILQEGEAFLRYRAETFDAGGRSPLFPLLFVTIACGIASGAFGLQHRAGEPHVPAGAGAGERRQSPSRTGPRDADCSRRHHPRHHERRYGPEEARPGHAVPPYVRT